MHIRISLAVFALAALEAPAAHCQLTELATIYPRTAAEIVAKVTPIDSSYPEGYGPRYGVACDGVTDDRAAIMTAYAVYKAGGAAPHLRGTCLVLSSGSSDYSLAFDGNVILHGGGQLTITGDGIHNYSLIYAHSKESVDIEVTGVRFTGGKITPSRLSDNADIGLRIGGDINRVNIADNDFDSFNEDGIYVNSIVMGTGGTIHGNRFHAIARSAITVVAGRFLRVSGNEAKDIGLIPFNVAPPNEFTVLRDINVDHNDIVDGGDDANPSSDRAAIYLAGKIGASASVQSNLNARGNLIRGFGTHYRGKAYAFGIETREYADGHIEGNEITGTRDAALYSYLTTRASFLRNIATGNGKGLWMNSCKDYTEGDNTLTANRTLDYDYHGPDGDSSYVRTDGLTGVKVHVIATVAGRVALVSGSGVDSITYLGTGRVNVRFSRRFLDTHYIATARLRSPSSATSTIEVANQDVDQLDIQTYAAGGLHDENFELSVAGPLEGVRRP